MRTIVIGMGEVGKHIAFVLSQEKHDVTIVDPNTDNLSKAEEIMDVMALRGHGASKSTLEQARVEGSDLVVAVSNQDEVNLLAAITAKKLGARRTVARVSQPEYMDDDQRGFRHDLLGIDLVISVQVLTAIEIQRLIRSFGAIAVRSFLDNRVEMIESVVPETAPVVDRQLRDIRLPEHCLVTGILRGADIIIPGGADCILAGDRVFLAGIRENLRDLETLFGRTREERARKILLVGGGDVGVAVARHLEREPVDVVLIESDARRCQEISKTLTRTVILHGNGTDLGLLREERIDHCDVFVAVSGSDETNLMSSLLAHTLGAKKTVSVVDRPDYVPIYELLGVDATVSPRLFAANLILKYVRLGEVVSVSLLESGRVEVLEIVAAKDSPIAGKPVRDAGIPRGAIVAAVSGEKGVFVPSGGDTIEPGNVAVVFTTPDASASVQRLFRKKLFTLR